MVSKSGFRSAAVYEISNAGRLPTRIFPFLSKMTPLGGMTYSILMDVLAAFSAYRSVNNCKYESLATKIIAMTESARMIFRYCDFICAFLYF